MRNAAGNIVLIGMPGAGKSTLGVVLAKILNKRFVDADLVIQEQCGKTLQTMIDEVGPQRFIQIEGDILCGIDAENTILATGGSAVYSDAAMKRFADMGKIVYLEISYDSLLERLGDLQDRGVVMQGGDSMSLRDLYEERKPLYERYADIAVSVDGLSITDAARKVAAAVAQMEL